ncbi:MAG: hypothetical protein ACI31V_05835 [Bacilli bacterium]
MNKNELKQARKELVDMMHALRGIQKERKTSTDKEKYNKEIKRLMMQAKTNNIDYYSNNIYIITESDKEFIDSLAQDIIEKQKKKK